MGIGLDEARRLYKQVPKNIKREQKATKLTKELLINRLWCGNYEALKLNYEILDGCEEDFRKSVGWD